MAPAPRAHYVIDTNVISETSPNRAKSFPALLDWLAENGDRLFITAITVFEISLGIAELRRTGATKKARDLDLWREAITQDPSRLLPFDAQAAGLAAGFASDAKGKGLTIGLPDLQIAGIAAARGMIVLTRNTKDFLPLGISVHDPFHSLPPG